MSTAQPVTTGTTATTTAASTLLTAASAGFVTGAPPLPIDVLEYSKATGAYRVIGEGGHYRGLLPVLRAVFYPHFNRKAAIHGPLPTTKPIATAKGSKRAMAFGKRVDSEIRLAVALLNK